MDLSNYKKNKEGIYPEIRITKDSSGFMLDTILRKEHEGIWYHWRLFTKHLYCSEYPEKEYELILSKFHNEVYSTLIVGIVQPNLVDQNYPDPKNHVFEIDPDQRSEKERINDILKKRFRNG